MALPQLSPVETISLEVGRLKENWEKISLPNSSKWCSAPQLHGAMKDLKGLTGDLFLVLESVLQLVKPVVSMGELCGATAVEIDEVQQQAKAGCLIISNNRTLLTRHSY